MAENNIASVKLATRKLFDEQQKVVNENRQVKIVDLELPKLLSSQKQKNNVIDDNKDHTAQDYLNGTVSGGASLFTGYKTVKFLKETHPTIKKFQAGIVGLTLSSSLALLSYMLFNREHVDL